MKVFLSLVLAFSCSVYAAPERPNIVVVMADDLGKGDLGFYHRQRTGEGSSPVPTPNLDRLIASGMRFSDAHSPAALCAPTRFSMMTGNYPYRNNSAQGIWGAHADPQIDPNYTTVARIAKEGGYRTAFFGKWGLGGAWKGWPKDYSKLTAGALSYGFDYSVELPQGIQGAPYALYENREFLKLEQNSIMTHIPIEQTGYDLVLDPKAKDRDGMGDSNWDLKRVGPVLAHKAATFIDGHVSAHPDQPFFVYYCSQAVHTPHCAAEEFDGVKIAGSTPGPLGDFIHELDVQVGMILKELEKTGTAGNTLFIFTSDNGGLPAHWDQKLAAAGHKSNGDLSGQKGSIEEGGHRVPFIAVWPGQIKPGSKCDELIVTHDVVSTIAAVVGETIDRAVVRDSMNLLPILAGGKSSADRHVITQSGGLTYFAIRDGDLKLIIDGNAKKLSKKELYKLRGFNRENVCPVALYDLDENIRENQKFNLINHPEYKERVAAMFERFCELRSSGEPTVCDKK